MVSKAANAMEGAIWRSQLRHYKLEPIYEAQASSQTYDPINPKSVERFKKN